MPAKRKETPASPAKQVKKAKHDPLTKQLEKQLREITNALNDAPVTAEVEKMLAFIMPLSLGEYSDQRHRFQQQVVEGVGSVLDEVEAALKKQAVSKRAELAAAAGEKASREKTAADASEKLNAKIAEVHAFKVTLSEKATAFRACRSCLEEAEEAKVVDGRKAKEAEKKKHDLAGAFDNLEFVKAAAEGDADAKKKNHDLMALLKKYKFEESMMIALPAALAKAPENRGMFDAMAITQLETEIKKLVAEQDAILAAAAPGQAACEAAITQAQAHLAAARDAQRAAAKAYDAASKELTALEADSTVAQKAVRENNNLTKRLERALTNAEVEVELFEQGPRDTFKLLRDRTTPPPVVEEEEEAVAEAMEETAEAEMPVAVAA